MGNSKENPKMSSSYTEMAANLIDLPEDIILKIFAQLSIPDLVLGIRQTCRYFQKLSLMPDLWKHVRIIREPPRVKRPVVVMCHKFLQGMMHQKCIIPVTYEHEVGDGNSEGHTTSCAAQTEGKNVPSVCMGCPHAAGVTLSHYTVEVKSVVTSVEERGSPVLGCFLSDQMFFPCVKNMTLVSFIFPSMQFLTKYRALTSLHIEQEVFRKSTYIPLVEKFIAQCFDDFKSLRNLETVTFILPCSHRFSHGVRRSVSGYVSGYFLSGPALRRLHLDICIKDKIVNTIFEHCCQLEHFKLCNLPLTVKAFRSVLQKPNCLLSSLKLTDCPIQDDRCVYAILKGFNKLEKLQLTVGKQVSDFGVRQLLSGFPELTVLKLSAVVHTETSHLNRPLWQFEADSSDDDDELPGRHEVFHAGYSTPRWPKEGKLQHLTLEGFTVLDASTYTELLSHQPALRSVCLTNCQQVSDACLATLTNRRLKLQSLGVFQCHLVTPVAVVGLITLLPSLESFECSISDSEGKFEHQLSKEGMQRDHRDSRLQSLCLRPWYDMSARELTALIACCPRLAHLTITCAVALTDDCVEIILRRCPYLQHLRLEAGANAHRRTPLTSASLQHVLQWGRRLQQVHWLIDSSFVDVVLAQTLVNSPSLQEFTILSAQGNDNVGLVTRMREEMGKLPEVRKKIFVTMVQLPVDCEPGATEKALRFWVEKARVSVSAEKQLKWFK